VNGFDLADPDHGVFASAHDGGAAIVFAHDEVVAAGPAGGALDGARGSLALGDTSLDVELAPLGEPMRLDGPLVGAVGSNRLVKRHRLIVKEELR